MANTKACELIAQLQKAVDEHGNLDVRVRDCSDGYDWSGLCVNPDPASPMEAEDGVAGTIDINVFERG